MRLKKKAVAAFAVAGVAATAIPSFASTIAQVEAQPTGTVVNLGSVSTDSTNPTVTAIGSSPQSLDGYTYTNYAVFAQDSTGAIDLFGPLPAISNYSASIPPAVGDNVYATGKYSPFDQIPEMGGTGASALTVFSNSSSENTVPTTPTVTIQQINGYGTGTNAILNSPIAGYYVALNNVFITSGSSPATPGSTFPTHANGSYFLTDGGPTNSLALFQWASSYSAAGALGGTPIPQGMVDLTGIVDVAFGTTEFVPFSITSVPEPTSLGLLGVASLGLLKRRRARR